MVEVHAQIPVGNGAASVAGSASRVVGVRTIVIAIEEGGG